MNLLYSLRLRPLYVQAGASIKEHRNSSYSQREMLWPKVYISPKNYEVHLYEENGRLIPPKLFSAGEKQILANDSTGDYSIHFENSVEIVSLERAASLIQEERDLDESEYIN